MGMCEERLRSGFVQPGGGLEDPSTSSSSPWRRQSRVLPEERWKDERQRQEQQQGTCQVDVGKSLSS